MDAGFNSPVSEPFSGDFLDVAENEIEQQHPEDPPSGMLEGIEAYIEQSSPLAGMPDAQPDTMLDLLEHSTERHVIPATQQPEYLQDNRLWEMMDALELATENQMIEPEEQIEALAPEPGEVHGAYPRADIRRSGEARFTSERPYPGIRMTGTQTGIRYNGGSKVYCQLYDTWASPGVCESCKDFEPASGTDGDNERCRYAF